MFLQFVSSFFEPYAIITLTRNTSSGDASRERAQCLEQNQLVALVVSSANVGKLLARTNES